MSKDGQSKEKCSVSSISEAHEETHDDILNKFVRQMMTGLVNNSERSIFVEFLCINFILRFSTYIYSLLLGCSAAFRHLLCFNE